VLLGGRLACDAAAADVFSYGVLSWELFPRNKKDRQNPLAGLAPDSAADQVTVTRDQTPQRRASIC
jgi:hypothetical protein